MKIYKVFLIVPLFFLVLLPGACDIIVEEKEEEEKVVVLFFDNTYTRIYNGETYYGYAKVYLNNDIFYVDYNEVVEVEVEPGYREMKIYVKEYNNYSESDFELYSSSQGIQTGGTTTIYIN